MSTSPDMLPLSREEPSGVRRSLSRLSIAGTLRRKTSRLLGRHGPSVSEPIVTLPPATVARPSSVLKTKRSWLNSVGAHFYRHQENHPAALESSLRGGSSQDAAVVEVHEHEQEEEGGSTATPSTPPSDNLNSPHRRRSSSSRRFVFGNRAFKLHSLPARFRKRGVALFGGRSSSSSGGPIEEKENAPMLGVPVVASRPANPGSWSSFRLGVQKAVREMVDGNFRFSDDHGLRNGAPTRPPPRVPLRTLWTIQSADFSDDHDSADAPSFEAGNPKPQPKPWSPDWSRSSRNLKLVVTPPSDSHDSKDHTATDEDDSHPDANADASPCPPPASSPLSSSFSSSPSSTTTATCTVSSPASSAFLPSPVSPTTTPAPAPATTTASTAIQNWDRDHDRELGTTASAPPTLRGGLPPTIGQAASMLPPPLTTTAMAATATTAATDTALPLEESMPTVLQVLREVQNRPERVQAQQAQERVQQRAERLGRSESRGENVAAGGVGNGSGRGGRSGGSGSGSGSGGSGGLESSRREDIRPVAVVI